MAPKLLVLAAASVVLFVYLVGRGEAPAVHCTDPTRSDCIAVAEGLVTGPGTYRIPGARYVFDVPAGRSVRVPVPRGTAGSFGHTRQDFGLPIPLRFRRLPEPERLAARVFIEAPAEAWMAWIVIDPRTGDELSRSIVTDEDSTEELFEYPAIRFVLDWATDETTERFPLDRVSILPAVEVLFARTAADLLLDEIVASMRRVTPPDGRYVSIGAGDR